VEIVAGETVRDSDGLAMSSRNTYLSAAERTEAPRLYRVLNEIKSGRSSPEQAMQLLAAAGWRPDYVEVRRRSDLAPPVAGDQDLVVLAAARLGTTRLIDSLEI
jgi:pantoate--beta-alanine ligase